MTSRRVLIAGITALAVMAGSTAFAQTAPKVEAAWARPTVQGQQAGGAFLTITGGSAADKLVGGSADVSSNVELHSMVMHGTTMMMHPQEAIDVPAGKVVKLEPGGLHIMFTGLKAPLKQGTSFPLKLRFEKGGEVTVDVKVSMTPPPR